MTFRSVNLKKQQQFSHYLTEGEKMVFFTAVGPYYLLGNFIKHLIISGSLLGIIAFLILFFYPLNFFQVVYSVVGLSLSYALQRWYFTKEGIQYILTNSRLIVQKGFFHISLSSANYHKITHIEVIQNWMERFILDEGQVIVYTSSFHKPIIISHIRHPLAFKQLLELSISQEKNLNGLSSI
jgi:hypothetical protein